MSRGIQRERQVRKLLEEQGWWVGRCAGSFGDADLIALKAGWLPRLIEVKSSAQGPYEHFRPADRADLIAAAEKAGAEAWLCWWSPRRRPQWFESNEWPPLKAAA